MDAVVAAVAVLAQRRKRNSDAAHDKYPLFRRRRSAGPLVSRRPSVGQVSLRSALAKRYLSFALARVSGAAARSAKNNMPKERQRDCERHINRRRRRPLVAIATIRSMCGRSGRRRRVALGFRLRSDRKRFRVLGRRRRKLRRMCKCGGRRHRCGAPHTCACGRGARAKASEQASKRTGADWGRGWQRGKQRGRGSYRGLLCVRARRAHRPLRRRRRRRRRRSPEALWSLASCGSFWRAVELSCVPK